VLISIPISHSLQIHLQFVGWSAKKGQHVQHWNTDTYAFNGWVPSAMSQEFSDWRVVYYNACVCCCCLLAMNWVSNTHVLSLSILNMSCYISWVQNVMTVVSMVFW
jgi:hypothetical protein